MKQALFLTLFFTVSTFSFAATSDTNSKVVYNDTAATIPGAPELLLEIINATGLQANFELKQADVLNIEAAVLHRKRYILYNPSYINWINTLTKNKWAAMALLAHEVGHHLNGHTIKKGGSSPQLELEADEFAGFILHRLGATLEQSQEVMKYIAKTETSSTHPGRNSRMLAIQKGWNKATVIGEIAVAAMPGSPSL